jgi:hypothetical protein
MRLSRRRITALAGAAVWLTVIGAAFAILSLAMLATRVSMGALVVVGVVAGVLVARAISILRENLRSPGPMAPRTPEEKAMLRPFLVVVAAEVVAFAVVNTICAANQHLDLMVPLDVLIVGIHFLPLARIFRVPRYYSMGLLFCGIALATLLLASASTQIGQAAARFVLPALGCAPVTFLIAAANLREAKLAVEQWRAG